MNLSDNDIDALAGRLGPLVDAPEDEADLALLQAWHAGELDDDDVARAEAVLAADPAARAFVDELDADAPSAFIQAWAVKHGTRAVRRKRPWVAPMVTLVALAAALALFVMRPPPTAAPPGYTMLDPVGALKLTRGDGPTAERLRIDDEATLILTLKPDEELDAKSVESLTARAFVDDGGKLKAAGAQGRFGGGGAWTLEASSKAIFGERLGARSLHVAFAFDEATLDGLVGDALPTTETDDGVRWLSVEVDYIDREEGSR